MVDYDRSERGDYFKKPTQYWFINTKPKNNLVFEAIDLKPLRSIEHMKASDGANGNRTKNRSEISPDYANRFIREFVL